MRNQPVPDGANTRTNHVVKDLTKTQRKFTMQMKNHEEHAFPDLLSKKHTSGWLGPSNYARRRVLENVCKKESARSISARARFERIRLTRKQSAGLF
jgi:hypothetical protein